MFNNQNPSSDKVFAVAGNLPRTWNDDLIPGIIENWENMNPGDKLHYLMLFMNWWRTLSKEQQRQYLESGSYDRLQRLFDTITW
jgi:hypothetical protein